jgi:photosystem II stability/assembly factor-like uncharacterized protein
MAHAVFISYASKDREVANAVCQALETKGVNCWMAPRDVLPGMEYAAAIIDALNSCQVFLVIFSETSNSSPQVAREVERAISKNRTVLTFRIDNTALSKAMEYYLSDRHWMDASSGKFTQHLRNLVKAVISLLPPDAVEHVEAQTTFEVTSSKPAEPKSVSTEEATPLPVESIQPGPVPRLNRRFLWGLPVILVIGLLAWWVSTLHWKGLLPLPVASVTSSPPFALEPSRTASVTVKIYGTPAQPANPASQIWKQINPGQAFQRDFISAIVFDPKDAQIIYAGTRNAGIFKSIDAGSSWKPFQSGLASMGIASLVIDNTNPTILYSGVTNAGVYKTTDGGEHWNVANEGITNLDCCKNLLVLDQNQPDRLLYSDGDRIYVTSNGAASWNLVNDAGDCPDGISALAMQPNNSGIYYAAVSNSGGCGVSGLYRSMDGGKTWTPLTPQIKQVLDGQLWISSTGNDLYVQTVEGRLFVSHDTGTNWTELNGCGFLILDPKDDTTIYCAGNGTLQKYGVFPEKPETVWWPVGPLPFQPDRFTPIIISPHSSKNIYAGGPGIWFSPDAGLTWQQKSNGLGVGWFELKMDPMQSYTLYTDDNGCNPFISSDSGSTWDPAKDWGCGLSMSVDGKARYWRESDQIIYSSKDAGKTWIKYSLPGPIESILAHPTQAGKVYAICQKDVPGCIYDSSDYGASWQKRGGIGKLYAGQMAFGNDQGKRIYLASGDTQGYVSNDFGETWQACADTKAMHPYSQTRLAVDPGDVDHLFIATRGYGILFSPDGCKSWQPRNAGLNNMFINTLAIDPNKPEIIYAGSDGGAFVSYNGAETWSQVNAGLSEALIVYSLVVGKGGTVYAGTPLGVLQLVTK